MLTVFLPVFDIIYYWKRGQYQEHLTHHIFTETREKVFHKWSLKPRGKKRMQSRKFCVAGIDWFALTKPSNVRVSRNFKWFFLSVAQQAHSFHKPGFHMKATIAVIAVIAAIADKNGSAIAANAGFHMIAAIVEWRTRGPGPTTLFVPFLNCESSTPTWGVLSCNYGCFST